MVNVSVFLVQAREGQIALPAMPTQTTDTGFAMVE